MLTLLVFIFAIISIFLLLAIVVFSLFLIIKHENFRTINNYLFLNLFLSDFLSSAIGGPIRLYFDWQNTYTLTSCYFAIGFIRAFGYISLSTLVFISVERYLKILDVHKYVKYINMRKIRIAIVIQWILAFILSFVIDVEWEKYQYADWRAPIPFCFYDTILRNIHGIILSLVVSIGVIIIVIIVHVVLFIRVKDHFKLLEAEENERQANNVAGIHHFEKKSARLKVEVKIAIMTIAIVLAYSLFVFPIIFVDLIRMFDQLVDLENTIHTPEKVIQISIALASMYPTAESILFLILNKPVWTHLKTTLTMGLPSIRSAAPSVSHPDA